MNNTDYLKQADAVSEALSYLMASKALQPDARVCYIAGRIRGNPTYVEDFARAARVVAAGGRIPINPVALNMDDAIGITEEGHNDPDRLRRVFAKDMFVLTCCDEIYLLRGDSHTDRPQPRAYTLSHGATAEHKLAIALGLTVWMEGYPSTLAEFAVHGDEDGEIDQSVTTEGDSPSTVAGLPVFPRKHDGKDIN